MKNKKLLFLTKEIWKGKSVTRAFLNERLLHEECVGVTIDIGGGINSNYLSFMKRADNVQIKTFDMRHGDNVDFETDSLPANDESFDTVLFLNVMEHIFNYQHIVNEVVRITKKDGQLIGFVPFLMWYHPDHSDYFRYTHEALEKIFARVNIGIGAVQIEPIQMGPFIAAGHMFILVFPRWFRVVVFMLFYLLDVAVAVVKKSSAPKFVLGYYFKIIK
jgi:SAM-dependent methyltransferase